MLEPTAQAGERRCVSTFLTLKSFHLLLQKENINLHIALTLTLPTLNLRPGISYYFTTPSQFIVKCQPKSTFLWQNNKISSPRRTLRNKSPHWLCGWYIYKYNRTDDDMLLQRLRHS